MKKLHRCGDPLSPREIEVLEAASAGENGPATARRLFLSPETIRSHRRHIMVKLGAHSMAQAVSIGYQLGLLGVKGSPEVRQRIVRIEAELEELRSLADDS